MDHVFRAGDVGADAFGGIVLGGRHVLKRGGVDHHFDIAHRHAQTLGVAHVADEVAQRIVLRNRQFLLHLELLELVARIDHDALGLVALQHGLHEAAAEGAGRPGDENALAVEIGVVVGEVAHVVERTCQGAAASGLFLFASMSGMVRPRCG